MLQYVFLGLFAVFSLIHLYHSWTDDSKKRAVTKPFLLLFLLLYYIFAADKINVFLIVALATSWLGDVLLIPKGDMWFTLGGISFSFCHLAFITVYIPNIDFSLVKWYIVIPAALIYYAVSLKIIASLKKSTPKKMLIPMYLYLIANSTMNAFALMQLIVYMNAASLIAYIGALLFFISDCTLFLVRYHTNKELIFKKHFVVMLTYLLGEFMITLGIVLLNK
ncbi:MAG: lysoplasmalogenase [Clostridiales bacterium]|nr:lysoplasmalogenase [Clostridiales bacterium]